MPPLPWRSCGRAEPEHQYLVLLSYLPLKRRWRIPWFLLHTLRITGQLRASPGLKGYSLYAQIAAKRFWTLSAWEDEAALRRFVEAEPHARTMAKLTPHMEATRFLLWWVSGAQLPVSWEEALSRRRGD